jgi:hypothetical protein
MDVLIAAANVAEDYKGGARQLAIDIDCNSTTLSHEIRGTGGAKLGLQRAVKMTQRSGDLRILQAFSAACGQMCIPLPEALDLEGSDCMRALSETAHEFAQLCREVSESLGDGRVTDNELQRITREAGELTASLHGLISAATSKNKELQLKARSAR